VLRLVWLVATFIALVLWITGCGTNKASNLVTPTTRAAAASPVSKPASENTFVASGPIMVENQVDVAATREGVVASIMAEPGSRVKRGQVLATLDDRQISADLEAARAKTRSIEADLKNWEAESKVLEADYQRAQKMWDAQLITKEQLDHAKYKAESDQWDEKRVSELLSSARHAERSLELEMDKTRIRAPFDGLVARRYVRAGQKVAIGDRLFWVTGESPLMIRFVLPERFLRRLTRGETLTVTCAGLEEQHTAKVTEISPVVDPSSGTIEVVAQLVGAPGEFRPGMSAVVHISDLQ
jgi:membrane fusion protein, multidrug efflux system